MMEFDRSHERQWYRVEIDWIASFIVRSYTEEGALHKVDLYCQSEPKLGLSVQPEGGLGLYPEYAKPLDPFEEAYYDKLGDETPVRLVEDRRMLDPPQVKKTSQGQDRNQLKLFS